MGTRSILLAVVSFLAVVQFVSLVAGMLGVDEKSALHTVPRYAANDPDMDALFIGSSHVQVGIVPEAFDRAMKERGHAVRSHVIGIPSASFKEMDVVIRTLLDRRPCCLRYIFLEIAPALSGVALAPTTVRAVRFFSMPNALATLHFIRRSAITATPGTSIWTYVKGVAAAVFLHYSNAGLYAIFSNDAYSDPPQLSATRGYVPRAEVYADYLAQNPQHASNYRRLVETQSTLREGPARTTAYQLRELQALIDHVASKGSTLVLLGTPFLSFANEAVAMASAVEKITEGRQTTLDFASTGALFDPHLRMDADHLNAAGAKMFTEMIATEFSRRLQARSFNRASN